MPLASRLGQIAELSWQERSDLARAIWELALANRRLAWGWDVEVSHSSRPAISDSHADKPHKKELAARVAWAIPRAAVVVPWRADCLRQAEAARSWLASNGLVTELKVGARKNDAGEVDAHAWLMWQEQVITGGAIEAYQPFAAARMR